MAAGGWVSWLEQISELQWKRAATARGAQLSGSGDKPSEFGQTWFIQEQEKGQKGSATQTYPSQLQLEVSSAYNVSDT